VKVLSMTQPWAFCVVYGLKKWETRSWYTAYRGDLLIHAAKGYPREARDFAFRLFFDIAQQEKGYVPALDSHPLLQPGFAGALVVSNNLVRGAIIGKVRLTECIRTSDVGLITQQERRLGDYSDGRWAWKLTDCEAFKEPIPAKGSLGLWNWGSDENKNPAQGVLL
jgi:hypothetical protein